MSEPSLSLSRLRERVGVRVLPDHTLSKIAAIP